MSSENSDASASRLLDIAFWVEPSMLAHEAAFVRHLVTGLRAEGHQVTFISQQGLDLSWLPTLGARHVTFRWARWERLAMLQRLRLTPVIDALRPAPPDVLVAWGSCDAQQIELLHHLQQVLRIPALAWCWDASELFSPLLRVPELRHVIAASEPIAQRATARPDTSVPVTLIRPGVYVEETLACFDVEGQMPALISLDPLLDQRLYDPLLRAARMLADAAVEYLLFAYDTGRDEYAIWRQAERMNLLDRLSFVPFHQDAEPLLLHGDLYLHVLPQARVQYRTLEAMGRGLAVVGVPNHAADYLLDGQTCRLIREAAADAWRDALADLIANRPKAIDLARHGQQLVRERHSMMDTLTQFVSLCRQVSGVPLGSIGR